jgi:hypothetical protein
MTAGEIAIARVAAGANTGTRRLDGALKRRER